MKGSARLAAELEAMGATSRGVNVKAFGARPAVRHPLVIVTLPPSVNKMFPGTSRRYTSPAYRQWKAAAYPILSLLAPPASLPCGVRLTVRGKVHRGRDLDNFGKGLLDGLVACGVLAGDSMMYVNSVLIAHEPDDGPARVEVRFG